MKGMPTPVCRLPLPQPGEGEGRDPPGAAEDRAQPRRVDGDQVPAADERARVRARSDVDHRMVADPPQLRVVPAAPQVVARLVVRGHRHPRRPRPVRGLGEVDRDGLPVRLVVVHAAEGRAPVVHRVQEEVLEDHIAALAHDPAVVGAAGRVHAALVQVGGRRGDAAGHRAAQEQRRAQQHVEDPAEQPDRGEPPRLGDGRLGVGVPADLLAVEGLLDEQQRQLGVRVSRRRRDQHLGGQLTRGDELLLPRHRPQQRT